MVKSRLDKCFVKGKVDDCVKSLNPDCTNQFPVSFNPPYQCLPVIQTKDTLQAEGERSRGRGRAEQPTVLKVVRVQGS